MYTYGKASNGTHVLLPYKRNTYVKCPEHVQHESINTTMSYKICCSQTDVLMKSMIVHDSFSVLCDRYGFELM